MKDLARIVIMLALAAIFDASAQDQRAQQIGASAPLAQAGRAIVLTQETKWVNVMKGETVKFVAGGVEFAWTFDGYGTRPFDLREVAPGGALSGPVMVYVAHPPGSRGDR
jgi:hypothetical protein